MIQIQQYWNNLLNIVGKFIIIFFCIFSFIKSIQIILNLFNQTKNLPNRKKVKRIPIIIYARRSDIHSFTHLFCSVLLSTFIIIHLFLLSVYICLMSFFLLLKTHFSFCVCWCLCGCHHCMFNEPKYFFGVFFRPKNHYYHHNTGFCKREKNIEKKWKKRAIFFWLFFEILFSLHCFYHVRLGAWNKITMKMKKKINLPKCNINKPESYLVIIILFSIRFWNKTRIFPLFCNFVILLLYHLHNSKHTHTHRMNSFKN